MVQRVGSDIASAITDYYNSQGKGDLLKGYEWEFNLVDNKDINAWAMPGGKVVVYTGILPITQSEEGLAVVLGHEIAHAIAQHGNERMSHQLVQQLGGMALQVALANKPQQTQDIFLTSYGIGSTVGAMLPFSRKEELEADKFGLFFSAMAGYDPQAAIPFWQRMAGSGGAKPPEFLSTHPADDTRIKKLQDIMPEAMKYYNASSKNKGAGTTGKGSGTKPKVKRIRL
jgi:predicted Zn-dependent protease